MSVKVVVNPTKKRTFPKLMIAPSDGDIIYVTDESPDCYQGVFISRGSNTNAGRNVGDRSNAWNKRYFIDFNGEITLSNE